MRAAMAGVGTEAARAEGGAAASAGEYIALLEGSMLQSGESLSPAVSKDQL